LPSTAKRRLLLAPPASGKCRVFDFTRAGKIQAKKKPGAEPGFPFIET